MSKHLSIEQKVDELRALGHYIEKREGGWLFSYEKRNADNPLHYAMFGYVTPTELTSDREISRLYKVEFEKGKSWKKTVKKNSNDMDRAAQRDLIKTEKFDDIPKNKRIKTDDAWNYS